MWSRKLMWAHRSEWLLRFAVFLTKLAWHIWHKYILYIWISSNTVLTIWGCSGNSFLAEEHGARFAAQLHVDLDLVIPGIHKFCWTRNFYYLYWNRFVEWLDVSQQESASVKRVGSCQRCFVAKLRVSLLLCCIKKPSSRRAGIAIVMCSFRDIDPLDAGSFFCSIHFWKMQWRWFGGKISGPGAHLRIHMNRHCILMYLNKDKQLIRHCRMGACQAIQFFPAICDCRRPHAVKANCSRDAQETDVWQGSRVSFLLTVLCWWSNASGHSSRPKMWAAFNAPYACASCILWFLYSWIMFEGSLEVKLPTIWTDEKQSREEAERRERLEERRVEEKESEERRCRCAKR